MKHKRKTTRGEKVKSKKIKVYTIYEETKKGDLVNIFSVDSLDDLKEFLQTNKTKESIKSYISRHQKIDNRYIVYIDYMLDYEIIENATR